MKNEFMRVLVPMIALGSATLALLFATGICEDKRWGMTSTLWLVICVGAWSYQQHLQDQARIIKIEEEINRLKVG